MCIQRRVEVSRFYSISFPYFELLHTIVTFSYKLVHLRYYAMLYNNVHRSQAAWNTCCSITKIDQHDDFTRCESVSVTVVRDRKIWIVLRTNQIAGFVTMPSWKKINKCYLKSWTANWKKTAFNKSNIFLLSLSSSYSKLKWYSRLLINRERGLYGKIADRDLALLTWRQRGQYGKAEAWDFP